MRSSKLLTISSRSWIGAMGQLEYIACSLASYDPGSIVRIINRSNRRRSQHIR
jgi:hypothetical protein